MDMFRLNQNRDLVGSVELPLKMTTFMVQFTPLGLMPLVSYVDRTDSAWFLLDSNWNCKTKSSREKKKKNTSTCAHCINFFDVCFFFPGKNLLSSTWSQGNDALLKISSGSWCSLEVLSDSSSRNVHWNSTCWTLHPLKSTSNPKQLQIQSNFKSKDFWFQLVYLDTFLEPILTPKKYILDPTRPWMVCQNGMSIGAPKAEGRQAHLGKRHKRAVLVGPAWLEHQLLSQQVWMILRIKDE